MTEGIWQMAGRNYGGFAIPKQIRTDADCRSAGPKFDNGARSPAKISDVTGRGLYLFVTPDESRPGNAASKLWRMGYRPLRQRQGWHVLARRRAARARQGQGPAQGRQRPEHREAARQAQTGGHPAF